MRVLLSLLLGLGLAGGLGAKGEYKSTYLYTEVDPEDAGGLILKLAPGSPRPVLAVAIGRAKQGVYRGSVGDDRVTWQHLPIDIYDLLLVSGKHFWEGVELLPANDPQALKEQGEAVAKEVRGVEEFFDGKQIARLEIAGPRAVVLLQQWRIGEAVAESGAVLKGSIHSLDLIWFERPKLGWQLVRRRQLYRDELDFREPFRHHHLPALGKHRVLRRMKTVGPVALRIE